MSELSLTPPVPLAAPEQGWRAVQLYSLNWYLLTCGRSSAQPSSFLFVLAVPEELQCLQRFRVKLLEWQREQNRNIQGLGLGLKPGEDEAGNQGAGRTQDGDLQVSRGHREFVSPQWKSHPRADLRHGGPKERFSV